MNERIIKGYVDNYIAYQVTLDVLYKRDRNGDLVVWSQATRAEYHGEARGFLKALKNLTDNMTDEELDEAYHLIRERGN